jgi:hypothetical protein
VPKWPEAELFESYHIHRKKENISKEREREEREDGYIEKERRRAARKAFYLPEAMETICEYKGCRPGGAARIELLRGSFGRPECESSHAG